MRWRPSTFAVWCAAVLLVACSSDASGPHGGSVETIVITPATATVSIGNNATLIAEARDADGTLISRRVTWSSEDPSIAEVSADGVVTGVTTGTVLVAASTQGKDAFAEITVNPTPVASVRMSESNRSMQVGQSAQLTAQALDAGGAVLPGRPITWSTSNAGVATVSNNGLVNAIAPGGAVITASSEGESAATSISVSSVPVANVVVTPSADTLVVAQTTQLSAQVRDASGASLTGRVVIWTTSAAGTATVTSQGLVTGIAPGTATITATSEGKSGSATVRVNPRPVSAVIVSPGQVTIFAGQTTTLTTLVTDDRGMVLTGRPINYTSNNTQVATVSQTGVVTGISAGTATVTATSEGNTGTATVTVLPEPVATVEVSPASPSVNVGGTVQLTAIARNTSGQVLGGRVVSWASSAPGIASISSSGFVTGIALGTASMIATIDGKQGSTLVSVRQPVASVTVTPSTSSITAGQTVPLTAILRDASNNVLTGRVVAWSSSNIAIATVSTSGVVTGVGGGSVTITASSEGKTGTATVTVTPKPVATVTVAPTTATVTVGATTTLVATARDADGAVVPGASITWTTSNSARATVSSGGVVTGVSEGTATITATSNGKTGTATITVAAAPPGPVNAVTVSPTTATVNVGATTTLTATARDANGTIVTGAAITWTTSNAGVATVSSGGVVTGVAVGNATITATSNGKTGTATITVQLVPVDRIVVTPANPSVQDGNTIQLTATLYDAQNNVLTGRTVTWTSSNTNKATVSSTGLVTARDDGNVTITASSGGKSGSTVVTVTK